MSNYYVYLIDIMIKELHSIGSPILLALAIVSSVSLSGRLYKDAQDAEKAEAAAIMSSAVACVTDEATMIP